MWDIDNEIPLVAYNRYDKIVFVNSEGNETVTEPNKIPGFAVIGIKINERIVANKTSSPFTKTLSGISLTFIDSAFDNTSAYSPLSKSNSNTDDIQSTDDNTLVAAIPPATIPDNLTKVYEAFNIYGTSNIGWQRDYVYYNITPEHTRGNIHPNFKECIVSFQMIEKPTAQGAFEKISNQDKDPEPDYDWTWSPRSLPHANRGWLEGEFEFQIKILSGQQVGSQTSVYFRATGDDLFNINYKSIGGGWYGYNSLSIRKMNVNIPLFAWDLEQHSPAMQLSIEEIDSDQVKEQSINTSVEYAANFEFNPTLGIFEKLGMKFGSSVKYKKDIGFKITTTEGSDILGDVYIQFGDPIIINSQNQAEADPRLGYQTNWEPAYNNTYYGGWYKIEIAPFKMF